jgi:hypothetical protein
VVHADGSSAPPEGAHRDDHRRRASHLYGLIISGAVLATAPDDFRLARVAFLLLVTLCIYWAAETYAHLMAARTVLRRDLTRHERRGIAVDGWPLVAASGVPLLVLAVEAVLGVETKVALDVTLVVNSVLLFVVGWRMSSAGGLTGARLVLSATVAGLLGLTMVVLKTLLH